MTAVNSPTPGKGQRSTLAISEGQPLSSEGTGHDHTPTAAAFAPTRGCGPQAREPQIIRTPGLSFPPRRNSRSLSRLGLRFPDRLLGEVGWACHRRVTACHRGVTATGVFREQLPRAGRGSNPCTCIDVSHTCRREAGTLPAREQRQTRGPEDLGRLVRDACCQRSRWCLDPGAGSGRGSDPSPAVC